MDRNTTKKGTYQLPKEPHGEQQQQQQGSGKDKDKGKDKLDAIWEECCRGMAFNYAKTHRELRENVKEFTGLWKYHTHNEMMPRELYNFYNAVTTNKHEFLLLEKRLFELQVLEKRAKALRFGTEPSEVGYHTYVDWGSKMPSDNPEINKDWSFW
jgi:hypothetical protein